MKWNCGDGKKKKRNSQQRGKSRKCRYSAGWYLTDHLFNSQLLPIIQKSIQAAEEWKKRKEYWQETLVPFCVGLAMFVAGGYFYFRHVRTLDIVNIKLRSYFVLLLQRWSSRLSMMSLCMFGIIVRNLCHEIETQRSLSSWHDAV